jgi:predicted GIY-YIG superfamily endonuclease
LTTPTSLYRLHDPQGHLLYVGIAGNPGRRFQQHARDKSWWGQVASVRLEHFPTREAAAAAEIAAIKKERPMHNIAHNAGSPTTATSSKPDAKRYRTDDLGFSPDSLVGSFFHSGPTPGWQGQVVAEPSPGVYLVETYEWLMGCPYEQRLVTIGRMVDEEWAFYDDASWMTTAYDNHKSTLWERQRAEAAATDPVPA